MKTKLVRIGNSRGVRLPKPLIEQAGLREEVEIELRGNTIVIAAPSTPRTGWAEDARKLRERNGDRLLDAATSSRFDETEWKW